MFGLLFTGGEGPLAETLKIYLESSYFVNFFSETPPLVVVADSGATLALDCGYLPHYLVGDMDSILPDTLELLQKKGVRFLCHPTDKDDSDTDLGLKLLQDRGVTDVILVGGGGGRMDHFLAIFRNMCRSFAPVLWLTGTDSIFLVRDRASFVIELDADVSFFPLGGFPFSVKSKGLHWELSDFMMKSTLYSLSNRSDNGTFCLAVQSCEEDVLSVVKQDAIERGGEPSTVLGEQGGVASTVVVEQGKVESTVVVVASQQSNLFRIR